MFQTQLGNPQPMVDALNHEIESLKMEKKNLQTVLDEKEREVKTLIQVRPLLGIGHLINVYQQTLFPCILVPTAKAQDRIFVSCLQFISRTKSSDLHSLFVHLRASYSIATLKVDEQSVFVFSWKLFCTITYSNSNCRGRVKIFLVTKTYPAQLMMANLINATRS